MVSIFLCRLLLSGVPEPLAVSSSPPEMNTPCCVVGCKPADWRGVELRHVIPRGVRERAAWMERIGLPASHARRRLTVCGRHSAPDAYYYNPALVRLSGMNVKRLKLRPKPLPTLFLPTGKEPAHTCTCSAARLTVATQTRKESLCASERTRECQSVATQVSLGLKVLVSAGTQTDPCALQEAPVEKFVCKQGNTHTEALLLLPTRFRSRGA